MISLLHFNLIFHKQGSAANNRLVTRVDWVCAMCLGLPKVCTYIHVLADVESEADLDADQQHRARELADRIHIVQTGILQDVYP